MRVWCVCIILCEEKVQEIASCPIFPGSQHSKNFLDGERCTTIPPWKILMPTLLKPMELKKVRRSGHQLRLNTRTILLKSSNWIPAPRHKCEYSDLRTLSSMKSSFYEMKLGLYT